MVSYCAITAMNRAFSAEKFLCMSSWGVAPGYDDAAPLALCRDSTHRPQLPGIAYQHERRPIEWMAVTLILAQLKCGPAQRFGFGGAGE